MSTISTQLRTFKEPTKDQLTEIFFSIPPAADSRLSSDSVKNNGTLVEKSPTTPVGVDELVEKMDINAVLSIHGAPGKEKEAEDDSYVSASTAGDSVGGLSLLTGWIIYLCLRRSLSYQLF